MLYGLFSELQSIFIELTAYMIYLKGKGKNKCLTLICILTQNSVIIYLYLESLCFLPCNLYRANFIVLIATSRGFPTELGNIPLENVFTLPDV